MQLSKLDFVKNYNNKLLCFNFLIIEPQLYLIDDTNDGFCVNVGEKYKISISKNHLCFAEIIMHKRMNFDQIIACGYNFFDAGLEEKEYYDYLYSIVSAKKKKEFDYTDFSVVWFKKITQLSLLDNNEIYEQR